jgi:16S rRNA C1402 N4-methylase RsmH
MIIRLFTNNTIYIEDQAIELYLNLSYIFQNLRNKIVKLYKNVMKDFQEQIKLLFRDKKEIKLIFIDLNISKLTLNKKKRDYTFKHEDIIF